MRLDSHVSDFKNITKSQAQILIRKELVSIDWKIIKKNWFEVNWSEEIIIWDFPAQVFHALPTKMPIDVIYEDENILVINKQKGRQVYPGDENDMTNTLLSWLRHRYLVSQWRLSVEHIWFIHRIDKETTWVLMTSKNKKSLAFYQGLFQKRKVEKIYLSLVHWHPKNNWRVISPIWRSKSDRKKMTVTASWKEAESIFDVLGYFENLDISLLKVQILTWRTHQIRVHLSSIWFPVVWDSVYWIKHLNDKLEKNYWVIWQILHAYSLTIDKETKWAFTFIAQPNDDFKKLGIELGNFVKNV